MKFQVDVSVGDVLVDPLQKVRCADWLAFANVPPPLVTVTSREQQFAEKLHAYTLPRSTPTAAFATLSISFSFAKSNLDRGLLGNAITATFERRGTHPFPGELASPDASWTVPFSAHAR